MAKKPNPTVPVTHASGRVLAAFRNGVYLIDTGKTSRKPTPSSDTTAAIAIKLGRALSKPGISAEAVFGTMPSNVTVYAFSVDPDDPTKLVRETADGKRTVGRMINGKFRAVRTKRVADAPVAGTDNEPTPDHTALVKAAMTQATVVFGSVTRAKQWLSRPAMGLNGSRPIDLLQTTQGAELVRDLLTRLEYGVYS